jgi:acetoin utilization protein AcuB
MSDTQVEYMVARDFINSMIPPLKLTDTVKKAIDWMSQFRVRQLAVVEEGEYLGIISDDELYDSTQAEAHIRQFPLKHSEIYVSEYQHFYEVIKEANRNHLQIIAVLDEFGKYKGVISLNDTATALARTYAIQDPGGILVLSMRDYDYSLTEIARLIESDNAKILSSYIESEPLNPKMIKLTLKLNRTDLTRIIATLERFEYNVVASFQNSEPAQDNRDRLDMLFKYLEM